MTKISTIGEFGLIDRFSKLFLNGLREQNITGIGDDCAIIPLNESESWLVTTDMLIEDRHFLLNRISAFELGFKSLAVNLSDIAAMGGDPHSAFLSIGIPNKIEVEWLDGFFKGIKELADNTNTLLLGGDTTKSPDKLIINILVLGKAITKNIKKRSAAEPGDLLCVTGNVGDSGGGLQVMLENKPVDDDAKGLIKAHHLPYPHLNEGKFLSTYKDVHAMIDLSDGIESDIHRIMEAAGCGAEIALDKLPVSDTLKKLANKYDWNVYELAMCSGEDYKLMVTVNPAQYDSINSEYKKQFNRDLSIIGKIKIDKSLKTMFKGKLIDLAKHGYDHFKNE